MTLNAEHTILGLSLPLISAYIVLPMLDPMFISSLRHFADEAGPRLALAEWYTRRGDPLGRYICLELKIAELEANEQRSESETSQLVEMRAQSAELFEEYEIEWLANWGLLDATVTWKLGLPDVVALDFDRLLSLGETILSTIPFITLKITGKILDITPLLAWATLPLCVSLDLSNTSLQTNTIEAMCRCDSFRGLHSLVLRNNSLQNRAVEQLSQASLFSNLRRLDLSGNPIDALAIRALARSGHLQNLHELRLARIPLKTQGIQYLSASPYMRNLETLDLSGTRLGDEGIIGLAPNLPGQLKRLDLGYNDLNSDGMVALGQSRKLKQLQWLDLHGNSLGNVGVRALARSPYITQLTFLGLGHTFVGDGGVISLMQSSVTKGCKELDLQSNSISPEGIRGLVAAPHASSIRHLRLEKNSVFAAGVELLAQSPHMAELRTLRLEHTSLGVAAARVFSRAEYLRKVEYLDLRGNNIADTGLQALLASNGLTNLRILDVCDNQLTFKKLPDWGGWPLVKKLEQLRVSSKEVPESIARQLAQQCPALVIVQPSLFREL